MWSRELIKSYAKDFLREHYWKAFLVCAIAWVLGGAGTGSNQWERTGYRQSQTIIERDKITFELKNPVLNFSFKKAGFPYKFRIAKGTMIVIGFAFFILSIAVGNIVEVGKVRFFLRGFEDNVDIGNLFSAFNSDEYLGILKTQFLRGLYNLLWTLLFIIPGIIKTYEYKMVPYILSKEPCMPADEAISMSRAMTEGHKWNMFVLDLSFLGWYLLGAVFFGIGGIFVYPYEEATYARLYNILSGNDNIYDEINK